LLYLLPWLPPRRAGQANQLTMHPGAARVTARAGETLLDAGLRAGLALPFDCRSGGCGVCLCTVHHGRVDLGNYQPAVLTEAMRARGQALMCCAVALDDVELEVDGVESLAPGEASRPPQRYTAVVQSMERLSPILMRLHIALPPGQRLPFVAGQYLNIILDDGAKRAFSFANPPADPAATPSTAGDVIELHVRLIPGGRYTTHVFEHMKVGDTVQFEAPLGRFTLADSQRPILFVAGATGFAPIKSIVEDAFRRGIRRPMTLYWGVRTSEDLYLLDLVDRWQREQPNFHFVPVLSDVEAAAGWTGRRGLVHQAMLADHPSLAGFEVYACGSVRMVEAAVPDFMAHGLAEEFCFSDAFVPTRAATPPPTSQPAAAD
ncbi:MAG TPA: 2Fe-2S iron-sulfur cluster-binding protein, partial [Rubrivivax sp.]|nr:2Fe-2S iron-sulfur cluster-binding protein [Rubrivivax sp.]